MKVQLDKTALEAMIGGDTEAEIEIRNSIVQAFAKKYLKGVANEHIVQRARDTVEEFVRKEIASISWSTVSLDNRLVARIRQAVIEEVDKIIDDQIETIKIDLSRRITSAAKKLTDSMDSKISEQINYATTRELNDRVAARFKQLSALLEGGS